MSTFHNNYPSIYNIKRSTVNVYKIDRDRSVRVRSTVSRFQTFALTTRGCPRREESYPGECPALICEQDSFTFGRRRCITEWGQQLVTSLNYRCAYRPTFVLTESNRNHFWTFPAAELRKLRCSHVTNRTRIRRYRPSWPSQSFNNRAGRRSQRLMRARLRHLYAYSTYALACHHTHKLLVTYFVLAPVHFLRYPKSRFNLTLFLFILSQLFDSVVSWYRRLCLLVPVVV